MTEVLLLAPKSDYVTVMKTSV